MENYGFLFDPLIGVTSVDIYFFSSGFLVAHWYLRDKANKILIKQIRYKEKLNELFIHIVKRFLRYVFYSVICKQQENNNNHNKITDLISEINVYVCDIYNFNINFLILIIE
jgi:hypothetical protein